ncbi:fasciclin domain-containing protein [Sphingomonas flavescens]|uniref:fasciclin domain-containing protein n=1 Tax=Sphingomonas flavescens TaxID=3132797 RepID=UPI002806289E|nr:fasciclin domain-containing protein [Sphingomonas limnosediminicola]
MKRHALALTMGTAALLTLGACSSKTDGNGAAKAPEAQTDKAQKAAGGKTIGASIPPNSQFMAAAKAAGLDQTLAGPGPYTVFVPDDAAFTGAPAGTFDTKPENRAQLTGVLTNLILPGTVMVADIDKAIDAGKGKAVLATMSGTLTATKDGGKTVLTDAAGHKATITQGDEQYTNGVVHHVDAMLMPAKTSKAPAVGQKKG